MTVMRAALVTLGPSWPGDKEWTGRYLFSSTEHARRYFESEPRVLSIRPDTAAAFFAPFEETLTKCPWCGTANCTGSPCDYSE